VGGSRCEVSLCEGAVSRAEGFAGFSHWRIREVRSDTPDRLDKRFNSPTAGRMRRSSESTVSSLKQSDKGFVACARRIATLQVKSAVINVVNGSDLTSLSDINDRHRLCKTVCMPYDFESKLCTTEDALGKLMASRNSAIYCSDAK
jgi:hypothetical protein